MYVHRHPVRAAGLFRSVPVLFSTLRNVLAKQKIGIDFRRGLKLLSHPRERRLGKYHNAFIGIYSRGSIRVAHLMGLLMQSPYTFIDGHTYKKMGGGGMA